MTTLTLTIDVSTLQDIRRAIGTAKTSMLLKDWTGDQAWAQDCYNLYGDAEDALNAAVETANIKTDATHAIVWNENGTFSAALVAGQFNEIITTWGTFANYYEAFESADADSIERHGKQAIFGPAICGAA